MLFKRINVEGLAHFSYLVGDEQAGVCAVIDPRRDIDIYLDLARQHQVQITHVLETHNHADFVSGSTALAAVTGASIGVGAAAEYGFEHEPLHDGDRIELGQLELGVLHTPGHTSEHVCYLIKGGQGAQEPWGLFTGDTLFAGEVGRPDVEGDEAAEAMARQLFHTLQEKLLPLGDTIVVYPAHGSGSPCGAAIGDRLTSTIGYERLNNNILHLEDEDEFVQQLLGDLSEMPSYYPRMKQVNRQGPSILSGLPHLKPLMPNEAQQAMDDGAMLLDTREIIAFGGAHVNDALNIALREAFPVWAGRMLDPDQSLVLNVENDRDLDRALRHLLRVGIENVRGYIRNGMRTWTEAGYQFAKLSQMSVHELHDAIQSGTELQVLDVRSDKEWEEGYIPTAEHIYLPHLQNQLHVLSRSRPIVTYCGSGYRASIAASLLQRNGFDQVRTVPGSMNAWKAAGLPLEAEVEPRLSAWVEW